MSKKTQRGMSAVLVGMMVGTGALAAPVPTPRTPEKKDSSTPPTATFSLKRGETKPLEVPGLSRVAVGDPAIADVAVVSAGVLALKAVAPGKTTVMVWTKDGRKSTYAVHVGK